MVVPGAAVATVDGAAVSAATADGNVPRNNNVTGQPDLSASLPTNRVQPGEERTLQVVLINDGNVTNGSLSNPNLERRVTTARALTAGINVTDDDLEPRLNPRTLEFEDPPDAQAPVTVETSERTVATLPDGASATLQFDVTVDGDAEAGAYRLPLNVTYNYTRSVDPDTSRYNTTTENKVFNLTLVVEKAPRFRVVDVDSNARVGATGTVDVTLKNTGAETASNASVALTSRNTDLTFGQASTGSRYVGDAWDPGEQRTVSYRVTAAKSASQQQYAFNTQVSYENSEGNSRRSRSLTLGITPDPEQTFTIVDSNSSVQVGNEGTVTVELRNDGPITVSDASVRLRSSSSDIVFGESASASQYVGTWAPNETRTVAVEATAVPGASVREYSMTATVSYDDRENDPGESPPLQFGLRPGPEPKFAASNVTSNLRVGEDGTLAGTITNTGDSEATNVVLVFESQSETVSPLESEYAVGTLEPGESANFEFDVEVSGSAEAGPRQFTLRPRYRTDSDDQRQGESFDVREQIEPQSDRFGVDVTNATVATGSTETLEVTVTNDGGTTVSDVSAKLFADDPVSVDDGEAFVDELGPGESETVVFEVSADGGALSKTYPVEIDFQYEDADGDTKLSSGYSVGLEVTEPEGGGPPVLVIVLVVVVLVAVGAVAYRRYG